MKFIFVISAAILVRSTKCEMDVQWVAEQSVFRQGNDVRLKCWGTKCTPTESKRWRGGDPYNLLCTETKSRDPEKYNLTTTSNGGEYKVILMIKNISMTDLNCNYTCNCGFSQYTNELSAAKFLYPPDTDPIYKSIVRKSDDCHIAVNISKVYPKPSSCRSILHKHNKIIANELETEAFMTSNSFYGIQVKSVLNCTHIQSTIFVEIVCVVKDINFIVFNETVNCEKYAAKISMPMSVKLAYVSLCLLPIVIVAVVFLIKRHRRVKKPQSHMTESQKVSIS